MGGRKIDRPTPTRVAEILNMYGNASTEQLAADITRLYNSQKMSKEMREHRNMCTKLFMDYLESDRMIQILEEVGVQIRAVTMFGSFPTACATKDGDIDLCICGVPQGKGVLPVTALQCVYRDLVYSERARDHFGHLMPQSLRFVKTAKVPIVGFVIDGVHVDLSCNFDSKPPRTSLAAKYINAYCQLDERFAILAGFLKMWMKSEGSAIDHLRDFPNSYSLTLLLIHALQWYGILPNIHKTHVDLFNLNTFIDWEMAKIGAPHFRTPLDEKFVEDHRTTNPFRTLNVVQLLYIFAFHYSNGPLLEAHRFNMKNGEIEQRYSSDHAMQILDPYDQRNPARSARTIHDFVLALRAFRTLLIFQDRDIFRNVMRITREKTYNYRDDRFLFAPPPFNLSPNVYVPTYTLSANIMIPPQVMQQMWYSQYQQQYQNNYPQLQPYLALPSSYVSTPQWPPPH